PSISKPTPVRTRGLKRCLSLPHIRRVGARPIRPIMRTCIHRQNVQHYPSGTSKNLPAAAAPWCGDDPEATDSTDDRDDENARREVKAQSPSPAGRCVASGPKVK